MCVCVCVCVYVCMYVCVPRFACALCYCSYRQLRARRALPLFHHVLLRTRRALSPYKVCGNRSLLVFKGTYSNWIVIRPFWFSADNKYVHVHMCVFVCVFKVCLSGYMACYSLIRRVNYSPNVKEWKSTLLGVILGIISFGVEIHAQEWFKPLLWSGFYYFESGFPLQTEVIPNMTPKRVDFHSTALREYRCQVITV